MKPIELLSTVLRDNRFTIENLPELESKLFFEGSRRRPYVVRFTVLIILSTIIATGGVLADSTATVIGAMIVAPLMTPILATTAGLVMGNMKRVTESVSIVLGGIIIVIILSWILGEITINVISFNSNSQIVSRTAPNLTDLFVALAAGAAGAFAFSRDDVADSLPGVAIAIALVPPLCVVGVSLSKSEWSDAAGASLLFLTNLLSILLAGGAVFTILQLGTAAIKGKDLNREARKKVYRYIILGVLLVTIPLARTSFTVGRDSWAQLQIINLTENWLEDSDYGLELDRVLVYDDEVVIDLHGPNEPITTDNLSEDIKAAFPRLVEGKLTVNFAKELPISEDQHQE